MKFQAYVILPEKVGGAIHSIDECNELRPIEIAAGPDIGKFYFDKDIINRVPQAVGIINSTQAVEKELDTDVIWPPIVHPTPPEEEPE